MDQEYTADRDEQDESVDFESVRVRQIENLERLLQERKLKQLQEEIENLDEYDVAEFLMDLPQHEMTKVFRMLSKEKGAEIFAELDSDQQAYIIGAVTDAELGGIIEEMYVDDAVDLMEELPANVVKRVMRTATPETRKLINQYLKYPENSAGSIMTAEYIDLKKTMSVREAFARIRRVGEDREMVYTCFVTGADRTLEGVVTVRNMIMADLDEKIENIMNDNVIFAVTTDDQEVVSDMFANYDLIAIPVVDREHRLVGIVTVDDVMDVLEQEATEDIEKMAAITPTDKPYLRTAPFEIFLHRIPWLLLLMVSATFTGMIITRFEDALAAQVALTAFIPMLMDTGGNSGSQSSVTIIRALSLGDVELGDIFRVIWKEFRVSLLVGVTLAAANFAKIMLVDMMLMKNDGVTVSVAAVICLTLIVTVACAEFVGCTLPILAKRLGFDPAVMASPFITTIVDAISLLVYFSFARMLLGL